jgi:L-fuculose-phosphate aldolase
VSALPDNAGVPEFKRELVQGLSILERLDIVDFNGHFSVRLPNGDICINSGASVRSALTPDQFVITAADGTYDESQSRPPMELPLHVALYGARPDVGAVVHCHPKWSTLLSSTGNSYEVVFAQGALLGHVPVYASPRSVNNPGTAADIAELLGDGTAAMMKSHGSVIAASNVIEATVLAIYLELNAERQVAARSLGGAYVFSPEETAACQKGLMKPGLFKKCWDYYLAKFDLADIN